jgi:hypothetical protein
MTTASEGSRRSSTDSNALQSTAGSATRLGKRKRNIENGDSSVIESNYSLRRKRIQPPEEDVTPPIIPKIKLSQVSMEDTPDLDELHDSIAPLIAKGRGRRSNRFRDETPIDSTLGTPAPGTPYQDLGDMERVKGGRRLPGRRRAPNSNPRIEADLRRQLKLKMNFRTLVKGLKPILDELSKRALDDLEDDENAHEKHPQYKTVQNQLDQYLQRRLSKVDAVFELGTNLTDSNMDKGKAYFEEEYQNRVSELKEQHVANIHAELMEIKRQNEEEEIHITDDENGELGTKRVATSYARAEPFLDPKYDFRSRVFLELDGLLKKRTNQMHIANMVAKELEDNPDQIDKDVMDGEDTLGDQVDPSLHESAVNQLNLLCLAEAAEEIETMPLPTTEGFDALLQAMEVREAPVPQTPSRMPRRLTADRVPLSFISPASEQRPPSGYPEHLIISPTLHARGPPQPIFTVPKSPSTQNRMSLQISTNEPIPFSPTQPRPINPFTGKPIQAYEPQQSSLVSPSQERAVPSQIRPMMPQPSPAVSHSSIDTESRPARRMDIGDLLSNENATFHQVFRADEPQIPAQNPDHPPQIQSRPIESPIMQPPPIPQSPRIQAPAIVQSPNIPIDETPADSSGNPLTSLPGIRAFRNPFSGQPNESVSPLKPASSEPSPVMHHREAQVERISTLPFGVSPNMGHESAKHSPELTRAQSAHSEQRQNYSQSDYSRDGQSRETSRSAITSPEFHRAQPRPKELERRASTANILVQAPSHHRTHSQPSVRRPHLPPSQTPPLQHGTRNPLPYPGPPPQPPQTFQAGPPPPSRPRSNGPPSQLPSTFTPIPQYHSHVVPSPTSTHAPPLPPLPQATHPQYEHQSTDRYSHSGPPPPPPHAYHGPSSQPPSQPPSRPPSRPPSHPSDSYPYQPHSQHGPPSRPPSHTSEAYHYPPHQGQEQYSHPHHSRPPSHSSGPAQHSWEPRPRHGARTYSGPQSPTEPPPLGPAQHYWQPPPRPRQLPRGHSRPQSPTMPNPPQQYGGQILAPQPGSSQQYSHPSPNSPTFQRHPPSGNAFDQGPPPPPPPPQPYPGPTPYAPPPIHQLLPHAPPPPPQRPHSQPTVRPTPGPLPGHSTRTGSPPPPLASPPGSQAATILANSRDPYSGAHNFPIPTLPGGTSEAARILAKSQHSAGGQMGARSEYSSGRHEEQRSDRSNAPWPPIEELTRPEYGERHGDSRPAMHGRAISAGGASDGREARIGDWEQVRERNKNRRYSDHIEDDRG